MIIPECFDAFLGLPLPLLLLSLLIYWGSLAFLVHAWLVPWIAGREGLRIGRLEAEVPAQIGLAFGLLISFIVMSVWEQHNLAEEAARSEAAAYREMAEAIEDKTIAGWESVQISLLRTVDFIVANEWPQLAHLHTPRIAASSLRELRTAIHKLPEGSLRSELQDLYRQAATARETRLRIAATRSPPARWGIVGALAVLTLLGVGLIHADSRRARRVALSMVSIGIACCFVILFAYTRPYLGQFAVKPDDLQILLTDLGGNARPAPHLSQTEPDREANFLR
ncbi:MAG: DUF4239 domain-containing protein [Planctomycetia bacterium]|nr:DUF4239 domain-containing protein [Planctomycetia bacterium]